MPSKGDKAAMGATAAGGTAAATGGILTGLGFTTSGIAAGSTAAGMQAGVGNVVAGSVFSVLQSLGAMGVFAGVAIGGGVAMVVGGGYLGVKKGIQWWKNKDNTPKPNI